LAKQNKPKLYASKPQEEEILAQVPAVFDVVIDARL
jgi:hypothetical protein